MTSLAPTVPSAVALTSPKTRTWTTAVMLVVGAVIALLAGASAGGLEPTDIVWPSGAVATLPSSSVALVSALLAVAGAAAAILLVARRQVVPFWLVLVVLFLVVIPLALRINSGAEVSLGTLIAQTVGVVAAVALGRLTGVGGVIAAVTLFGFGFAGTWQNVRFVWSEPLNTIQLDPTLVNSQLLGFIVGILAVAATLASWYFRRGGDGAKAPVWLTAVIGVCFLVGLVVWVGSGGDIPVVFLLTGAIGLSTAVVFGALSGVIGERVGVINIAIEGQLLGGAFISAVVASVTDNLILGLLAAMIVGALLSMVLAGFAIKYLVDQVVVGVVLVALMFGLTNFFDSAALSNNGQELNFPGTFPFLPIPLLSDIPVLGPVLFDQRITTYVMFGLVPLTWFVLFKTRWGLRIRALGEHPLAADTVGINVNRWRFWTVTLAGTIAGFGGAALTLGSIGPFVREMSAGQGFIALACVILGRWNPFMAAAAALLFGFSRNFRIWAGQAGADIPPDLIAMAPYLVTLIAVAVLVGRAVAPKAVGRPYIKE
jgi:simple sugar transport system permease protein